MGQDTKLVSLYRILSSSLCWDIADESSDRKQRKQKVIQVCLVSIVMRSYVIQYNHLLYQGMLSH